MIERDEIQNYYDRGVQKEWTRMDRRPIEFELTKRHIESLLVPGSKIADIGSGPGRYAIHFAKQGHNVTIVDLSKNNLDRAISEAIAHGVTFDATYHLSATDMRLLPDNSYDAVLCLGPLYHLTEENDRDMALGECHRILRQDGLMFVAFLSPYAHAVSALMNGLFTRIGEVRDEYDYILKNGRNRGSQFLNFTYAWYPAPTQIISYMEAHQFRTEKVAALEPLGWSADERLNELTEQDRNGWYTYLYEISTDSSLTGACQHMLFCGRKYK